MPDPAPAPAPNPAPAPAPAPAAAWHGVPETDTAGLDYIKNKGWQGPADVINSYRGAEKLIGRDPSQLLTVPRADDPVGTRAVLARLGLPESPDKYEIAKPGDGLTADANFEKFARTAFFEAGVTAPMAKEITAKYNEFVASTIAQQQKDYDLSVAADKQALLGEWKGGHERMINAAQTAAKTLGFSAEMVDAMERTVGYAATMKFFANLGTKLGEDSFVTGGDKGGDFTARLTPAEAKAQWEKLKVDANWQAAAKDQMHPGHEDAKRKQAALFKVMYPES